MPLDLSISYFVNWISGQANLRMFDYDRSSGLFTPTQFANDRAEFQQDDNQLGLILDNEYAFFAYSNGNVASGLFIDKLAPFDFPRIELYRQVDTIPTRIACISKRGIVTVPDVFEVDEIPDGDDQIILFDRKISFNLNGLYVTGELQEITLLADEANVYISDEAGTLIQMSP